MEEIEGIMLVLNEIFILSRIMENNQMIKLKLTIQIYENIYITNDGDILLNNSNIFIA